MFEGYSLKVSLRTTDSVVAGLLVAILLKMMDTPYMVDDLSALDLEYARDVVTDWLNEKGYEPNEKVVDELAIVSNRLNRVRADANQLLIQNRLAEYEKVVESLKGDESDAIGWYELYELFLESKVKQGLSSKMQNEYRRFQEYLERMQSDYFNAPIDRITKKQVKEVVMGYRTLPKGNRKPYKGMTWGLLLEYIEENEIDVEDCQSPSCRLV